MRRTKAMNACLSNSCILAALLFPAVPGFAQWDSYAHDAQHTALSPTASQALAQIHWQTPVDLNPQYSGNDLLIHYGSPLITAANTVIVPVKTGKNGNFRVDAHIGATGALLWSQTTDYILPAHNWTPVFGPVLTDAPKLYYPGAAGTVYSRNSPDHSSAGRPTQLAFYGLSQYQAGPKAKQAFQASVQINTPLTADSAGNIYFGFVVVQNNIMWPLYDSSGKQLVSGIARISAGGQGAWTPVTTASGDSHITEVVQNCTPAISRDGGLLYISVSNGSSGYLLALNSTTLAPVAKALLKDPKSGLNAVLSDNGTASPMVGPDNDVYYGVLENPCCFENHDRGWMLHFSSDLSQLKIPGAFGWDDTAAVVPASMVPSYSGTSAYLLFSKYNNYIEAGGDGLNKIAILDPNATEIDPITGATVMNEVMTIVGPTPNAQGGVYEWCINSAAVDPATKSVFANSEDGTLYRWDLTTNTLSQKMVLTSGIGEAYTPTVIGVDGTVYAINNATLFAVGQ
ncbi:MAG: hypothetical protein C5B51_31040 [Terriglobia bacterium]|nr:MAG: hypothetical protein C5B51_31040 [Terriglobia bacterium]